jgi:hypothetical protein
MKYALTLSRWHKVAERINTALKERETSVKKSFTATTVSPWNKEGIETGARAVAQIRAALAIRNAELGIAARLAEAEAANRTAALYKSVIEGQDADMVRPESVRGLPVALIGETDPIGFGRRSAPTVTLQTADGTLVGSLRERLAREQARATRLLDEVADLNREKLEIDVPREVVEIAGLAV